MAVLTTGRLPTRLTPLVGRERELGAVIRALARCRLLTLTGPGGAGKTRLALAAATALAAQSAGAMGADVAWVELAPVSDPRAIGPTVAAGLGAPETPGTDPVVAVAAHLAARPVLVVLDNCEHLAAEIAGLVEFLLAECPSLRVLATSREPLGVDGELSWPVPPLAGAQAAKLFEDRARLVVPSFSITDANGDAIAEVCEKLDGLPLAIELAAARLRVLSVWQLASRLDDAFGVLTGGARSSPPRHQALRATLDWSHALLNGEERAVFRRLAVFVGGFTLAAAERVAAFDGIRPAEVLDLLTRLADKSLLRAENERYQLLATIREYAAEKLAQAGERDRARRAHLAYYTEFAEEAGDRVEHAAAGELEEAPDGLDLEQDNLRAATTYARDTGDAVAALWIVGRLGRGAAASDPAELEAEPGSSSPAPRSAPTEVFASPLTGATPIMPVPPPVPPVMSPLTGATPILPVPQPTGSSGGGGESATPVPDDGVGSAEPPGGRVPGSARATAARPAGPAAPARRAPASRSAPTDHPAGPLRVRALGKATVELGDAALTAADWGYAKPRELLFLLITSPPLTREQLRAAIWPELSGKQLGNALHTALRELRRALGGHDWVRYAAGHYSVNRDRAFDCDVDTFESSLAAAGRARPASTGLPDLRRAVAAYGGDFLAGMPAGDWAGVRRDELRRRFETALLATGRLHAAAGSHQAAITAFRRAIEHEPLNESAHRELMTSWSALGETARAVRHYSDLTALLKDRVGVPPAAETTALYERLSGRAGQPDRRP